MSEASPRTILHLISELDDGGMELMLTSLVARLDRRQFEPFVICFGQEGDLSGGVRHTGVPLHHLNVVRSAETRRALASLQALMKHISPSLVHCWVREGDVLSAIKPAQITDSVPVLTSTLAAPSTKSLLSFFQREGNDLRNMPVRPAVDLKLLRPDDVLRMSMRERWNIPLDALVVGMAARQMPQADYATLFSAVAALQGLIPNVHLILTGREARADHADIARLRALCPRPDRVHLLGVQTDMAKVIPAWDLGISSVMGAKILPLSVAECLACGVPVVATDAGDAQAFLEGAGRVVKQGDVTAMKDAAIDILCRPYEARRVFANQARASAEAVFDLQSLVTATQDRYKAMLA